jgi:hypothetical protein
MMDISDDERAPAALARSVRWALTIGAVLNMRLVV